MSKSSIKVQIFAAASNAAFADRLTQALHGAGFDIVNGAFDPQKSDVVVIVWSGSSINASRLIEAARAPLAVGALAPVSIGRIEPPEDFRHLPPIDLAGWTGDTTDIRWRSVIGTIERVAAARFMTTPENLPGMAAAAPIPDAETVITEWPQATHGGSPAAFTPSPAPGGRFPLQPSLVFGLTLIAAIILGGFISLVSRISSNEAATEHIVSPPPERQTDEAPPILAVIEPAPLVRQEPSAEAAQVAAPEQIAAELTPPEDQIAELIAANDVEAGASPPADAQPRPVRILKDCDVCPEMAVIPAGTFALGAPESERQRRASETPVVDITIAREFALSTHEVTFAEWDACVAAGGCPALSDSDWGRGALPAINVSWDDANAYIAWLSKTTAAHYRLPTEAEWEYAARAGATTPFSYGEGISSEQANFDGALPYLAASGTARRKPLPVGTFAPNAFGLYDMHGNVWEWVADCWTPSHEGQSADGAARGGACSAHVLKGGAWNTGGWRLRAAHRLAKNSKSREYDNGFRVARDLD